MRITAEDVHRLGIIDKVVPEPVGGAHRSPEIAIDTLGKAIWAELDELSSMDGKALRADRRRKFLAMGAS